MQNPPRSINSSIPVKRKPAEDIGEKADNQSVQARPITSTRQPINRKVGRPEKLIMPDMPALAFTAAEQPIFDFFIAAYNEQYPDLTATDQLTLFLAGIEFIKYIRVAQEELETGKVITMSRQHPGVNYRALLDQLSVTRKSRIAKTNPTEDEDALALKEFFMQGGKRSRQPH